MLFAFALVLAQALAIRANVFQPIAYPAIDLEALCAGKDVDLIDFAQLHTLEIAILDHQSSSCTPNTKKAILDSASLIRRTREDLCTVESIEILRGFYSEYLDSSNSDDYEKLPKSLKRFALAYGMQMSNLCKKNMVKVLAEEARQLLSSDDFEQVDELVGEKGPVAEVLGAMVGPDEIFLPGDLALVLRRQGVETRELDREKLFMQTSTGPYIKQLQAVCELRFKPIYGPLMLPLVRLSNMGFNYKDEPLRCDLKCPTIVNEVSYWSRVLFLCEALTSVEIIEVTSSEQELTEDTGKRLVRILTREEAEALKEATQADSQVGVVGVSYEPKQPVALEGKILDGSDKRLARAIKSFKINQNEEDKLRKRMLRKCKSLVISQLKRGHFGLISSATLKALRQRINGSELASPVFQIVKLIDEMQQVHDGLEVKPKKGRYPVASYVKFVVWVAMIMLLWSALISAALIAGLS